MVQETWVYFQVRNFIILKKYYVKIIENFELNSSLNVHAWTIGKQSFK